MHNFKKIIKTIVVVAVCVTLLAGLDMALYPCTFMRNDIHAVEVTNMMTLFLEHPME